MYKKFKQQKEHENGFTLVELLVVIIIIGILAAVAIPAFLNQRQRANDAAVQSDIKNISAQIESALVQTPDPLEISTRGSHTGTIHIYVGNDLPFPGNVTASNASVSVPLTQGVVARVNGDKESYRIEAAHVNGKRYIDAGTIGQIGAGDRVSQYSSDQGGLSQGAIVTYGSS